MSNPTSAKDELRARAREEAKAQNEVARKQIKPPRGYRLFDHGGAYALLGRFDEDLNGRLHRLGAWWDGETGGGTKAWWIPAREVARLLVVLRNWDDVLTKRGVPDQERGTVSPRQYGTEIK